MATITGTAGKDVIDADFESEGGFVTDESDFIEGLAGNDKIFGLGGDDIIDGGKGNDQLTGGEGSDTFVFGGKSDKDTIKDFDVGTDVLQISKMKGIKNAKDVLEKAKQLKNGDVEINLGKGTKIILKDVSLKDLKKNGDIDVV